MPTLDRIIASQNFGGCKRGPTKRFVGIEEMSAINISNKSTSKKPFLSSDCPSFNVQGINCCLGKKSRIREVCGDIVIKMVIPNTLARDLDALALLFSDMDNNHKFISRWPQLVNFVLDKLTNALAFFLAFGSVMNVVPELQSFPRRKNAS